MKREFVRAFVAAVVFTILLGVAYPLLITGVSQGIFPAQANGSLIRRGGVVVGSSLIGQRFFMTEIGRDGRPVKVNGVIQTVPDPRYFQTRPSSTSDNAESTAFSNLGPNNTSTLAAFRGYVAAYLALNRAPNGSWYDPHVTRASQIPVDAAADSASSVDPDISVANARIQAYRVAAVRRLSRASVQRLVAKHTTSRSLGFLGEPVVDVLELNLALDRLAGSGA